MQINLNRNTLMIGCAVQLLIVGLIIYIFLPLISLLLKILVAVVLIAAAAYFGYRLFTRYFTRLKPRDEVISFVFQLMGYYSTKCGSSDESLRYRHLGDVVDELHLEDQQVSSASSYFNYGKDLTESLVKQMIRDNRRLWAFPLDRRRLFDWVVQLFFCEPVITEQQQLYFSQLGTLLGYTEDQIQYKFKLYLRRYRYFYDQNSRCYRNGFDFNEFFSRFYEQMRTGQGAGGGSYGGYGSTVNREEELASAYRILGIDENTSDADAKKAYLRLMNRYHPDKAAARGLGEEEVAKYKEMSQKIQAAWQIVKQHRGL